MIHTSYTKTGLKLLRNKFSREGLPLAVRWNLTYRCNLDCSYCNLKEKSDKDSEVSTNRVKEILEQMKEAGVQRISLSGGEPLLREDIGEIIDYADSLGINPTMNSNGILIPEKIDELINLGLLKISLDGSKSTHNKLRGKYEDTIRGLETALDKGIKTTLCTTFTKENYKELKNLIKLAENYNTVIAIQRATNLYENFNGAEELLPKRQEIRKTMEEIIEIKKNKPEVIRNSERHLKLIRDYPNHEKIKCMAGDIFAIILPNGDITPCDRISIDYKLPNIKEMSFREAFSNLNQVECSGCCFCGSMELNYLYHFKMDVLKDLINFLNIRGSINNQEGSL